jgi:hypothetical protein
VTSCQGCIALRTFLATGHWQLGTDNAMTENIRFAATAMSKGLPVTSDQLSGLHRAAHLFWPLVTGNWERTTP